MLKSAIEVTCDCEQPVSLQPAAPTASRMKPNLSVYLPSAVVRVPAIFEGVDVVALYLPLDLASASQDEEGRRENVFLRAAVVWVDPAVRAGDPLAHAPVPLRPARAPVLEPG